MTENQDKQVTSNYLNELNDVQRAAVTTTEGPVLVVAGPGSGKTRVLTYRVAYLIEQGVAPWEILALTFTNKAAREMKNRIAGVVGDKAKSVWAGTFHSIFARILRVEADKLGYKSNFTIYDSDDSKSVIKSIIKELNLNKDNYNVNTVRSRISSAKSNLISPKLYERDQQLLTQDRASKMPHFLEIYKKYMSRCKRADAMDFDDLLYKLFVLLHENKDNVCEKYQQKFKYLMVDEFQDTNYLQYSILKKLSVYKDSPNNICAVGDDAQSIYAFRGATIENILDFEKDFKDLKTFKLEQNYRSTEHIVQAANEVIQNNSKQIPKKIWSHKGVGDKIKIVRCLTDNDEGRRVADMIVEQKNRIHFRNSEIAILYRTNAQSRIFEEYLRRYNLPYRIIGGQSFYQRKEIKDFIAYLRLTVNHADEEAFRRIVNYPKRGIGQATIAKLSAHASEINLDIWEAIKTFPAKGRAKSGLLDFKATIKLFADRMKRHNAHEVASYIARQSGLLDLLKRDTTIEGMGRLENINSLLDGIKEFVEDDEVREDGSSEKSLAAYLQNIALLTDADKKDEDTDYITMMSVHAAKGLEFKSIFVVGLEEKLFPSFRAVDDMNQMDEERRLFYVAITRAETNLTLTFANSRYKFGEMKYNKPSRFLLEIAPSHLHDAGGGSTVQGGGSTIAAKRMNSGVIGNFKKRKINRVNAFKIDPKDFKPSPGSAIEEGMEVLHMKFGKGKVINIDGNEKNRVATILFQNIDSPQRRLMLKFAKLQIVE